MLIGLLSVWALVSFSGSLHPNEPIIRLYLNNHPFKLGQHFLI